MANSTLWLTIDWREADADVPPGRQEAFTETLFRELNGFDEVERVERALNPQPLTDALGARWLWSILKVEVTLENLKQLGQEIQERLPGRPIDFEIEVKGKKVSVQGVRSENLDETLDWLVGAAKELAAD